MEKCSMNCTSQGIGAPQFEDMVNKKTNHVVLIEPRQYLILHFFPSPTPQTQILPGMFILYISSIFTFFSFFSITPSIILLSYNTFIFVCSIRFEHVALCKILQSDH
ncbi:hypothetical protein VIGAN_06152100 [Vigna angularis var. angularis]|uniref:Uncharacterized protein n=1 Tax=Vigna angularis var. angularis TaxID=157739 RepID=A0A0S3SBW9_PHAAN|nr:hypothetical protein VIGAN_06152100 [Vigna angularis var. angularis]